MLVHMATMRSSSFDYAGVGDKVFNIQSRLMETVRNDANIKEVTPDQITPEAPAQQVFGGSNTHYSNGNQPHLAVDAENMAHSAMRTRTGMLSNPMERAASLTDIVAPSRSKPIPVRLVPQAPAKLPFPTPQRKPLLHKDSRSETQSMI